MWKGTEYAVVSPSYVKVVSQVILQRRSPSCQDGFSLRPGLQILHSVHHMSRRPVYHPISWTNVKVLSPAILPLSRKPFCARVFKVLLIPYSNNVLCCLWDYIMQTVPECPMLPLLWLLFFYCIGSGVRCEVVAAFRSWLFWFFLVSSTVVLLLLFFLFFHFVDCGVGCEGVQVAVVQENDNQLTTLPNTQTPFIIFFKFLLLLFSYSCCRCLHIVVVVVVLPIFPAGVSFHLR